EMERHINWAMAKPGEEDLLLSIQSDTEAYFGRLTKAREYSRRAMDSAKNADSSEAAALWQANAALREAEFGNAAAAKQAATAAMAISPGKDVTILSALALARAGDAPAADKKVEDLTRKYPLDTELKFYWLPTIKAALALDRHDHAQALELLLASVPYE